MGKNKERLVVVIPTLACRPFLPAAIRFIINQTYRNFDLYVIDDASDDITDEMYDLFPNVTFVRLAKRQGPYAIANMILKITSSGFIAFQDADDESHPERFDEQISFLARENLAGCGSWFKLVDIEGDPVGFETCPSDASQAVKEGLIANPLLHPAMLYDRKIFSTLVGFDGNMRFGADTEFFLRASLRFKLGNVQRFLYTQTIRPNSLTSSKSTGFASTERKNYTQNIYESFLSIQAGKKKAPPKGRLLNGTPVPTASLNAIRSIRVGAGNVSLKEEYAKRYTG